MRKAFMSLIVLGTITTGVFPIDRDSLIVQLRNAGLNGQGDAEAANAWKQLSQQGPEAVIPLLNALDGARPVAANWIRSVIDAIVDRHKATKQTLPLAELKSYLKDTRHSAIGRRMAFELIIGVDPRARAEMLAELIDDPAPELRFEAVKVELDKARAIPKGDDSAIKALTRLLGFARDFTQTEDIAKELEVRGRKVDLTDHFGFLLRWRLLGQFDNADGKGFAAVYPPESMIDLKATPPGKNGADTKWKFVESKGKYGAVDLNKEFDKASAVDKLKNVVAYAHAEVESDADREVELRIASATAVKAFLNGKEVMAREVYHQSFTPDMHIAAVKLKKGQNSILLKICQNDQREQWAQEWQFQMRITDASGAKVAVKDVTPLE